MKSHIRKMPVSQQAAFGRLLVIVLPASLVFTYIAKFLSSDGLRRDAIAELMSLSDRAALEEQQAQRVLVQYVNAATQSQSSCSDHERQLLFRAGGVLGGGGDFLLRSGWGEVADCCQWKGIACDASGSVKSLSLPRSQLVGTLPTELGALPRLSSLDLNENPRLSGTLPSSAAAGLPGSLTHIYAFGCRRLSGTLPAALGGEKALEELELSACKLSGSLPSEIGQASTLRYVFLESNRLSGVVPPSLSRLRHLRELELSHNRLSGSVPRSVVRLPLEHLDFSDNTPGLRGVPTRAPKQGCSGGSERYLRGGNAAGAVGPGAK